MGLPKVRRFAPRPGRRPRRLAHNPTGGHAARASEWAKTTGSSAGIAAGDPERMSQCWHGGHVAKPQEWAISA